jgi:hypothetical protein
MDPIVGGAMEQCESKVGGICAQPAIWKQTVHAGPRDNGRFLMFSYWCDEHAGTIVQRRRREWLAPPRMARLVAEIS